MTKAEYGLLSLLLVSDGSETPWAQVLQRGLCTLGELEIVPEREAMAAIAESDCAMVIVDAGAVQNVASFITCLRASRADLCIVVFTSSPTWQRAREVFLAGAADYVRKSLDEMEQRALVESALKRLSSEVRQ